MIELTEEDRTAIERIYEDVCKLNTTVDINVHELIAVHFLAAGIERAAKVCDELLDRQMGDVMDGSEFADAIRALKD